MSMGPASVSKILQSDIKMWIPTFEIVGPVVQVEQPTGSSPDGLQELEAAFLFDLWQ